MISPSLLEHGLYDHLNHEAHPWTPGAEPAVIEAIWWDLLHRTGSVGPCLEPGRLDWCLGYAHGRYLGYVRGVLEVYHDRKEAWMGLMQPAEPARQAADAVCHRAFWGLLPTWDQLYALRHNVPMRRRAWYPNSEGLRKDLLRWQWSLALRTGVRDASSLDGLRRRVMRLAPGYYAKHWAPPPDVAIPAIDGTVAPNLKEAA